MDRIDAIARKRGSYGSSNTSFTSRTPRCTRPSARARTRSSQPETFHRPTVGAGLARDTGAAIFDMDRIDAIARKRGSYGSVDTAFTSRTPRCTRPSARARTRSFRPETLHRPTVGAGLARDTDAAIHQARRNRVNSSAPSLSSRAVLPLAISSRVSPGLIRAICAARFITRSSRAYTPPPPPRE
jgi:hypothetical protein